jgi:hypothetical protein
MSNIKVRLLLLLYLTLSQLTAKAESVNAQENSSGNTTSVKAIASGPVGRSEDLWSNNTWPVEIPDIHPEGVRRFFEREPGSYLAITQHNETNTLRMAAGHEGEGAIFYQRSCRGDCQGAAALLDKEIGIPPEERGTPRSSLENNSTNKHSRGLGPQPKCYVRFQADCIVFSSDARKFARLAVGDYDSSYSTLPQTNIYFSGSIRQYYYCVAWPKKRRASGKIYDNWSSWTAQRSHDSSSVHNFGSSHGWDC